MVVATERFSEHFADRNQNFITRHVAIGIINGLESVQVQHHDAGGFGRLKISTGSTKFPLQCLESGTSVPDSGQRIVSRLKLQRFQRLIQFVESSEFLLVETLAERIAGIVLGDFAVPYVKVSLSKPGAIRGARDVGVTIERSAETS